MEIRPGAAPLRFGDTILLFGHRDGIERLRRNHDLRLLEASPFPIVERWKGIATLGILVCMVACVAGRVLDAAAVLPMAALAVVLLGCLTMRSAYESIDWRAVAVVGGMIPYGLALEKTGTATYLAESMSSLLGGLGPAVLLGALMLVAVLMTQVIENAAVAVLLAPLAYDVAISSGMNPRPVLLALAISISSAFLTPIAHESTILVMGPGRYEFKHYLSVGAGFALLTWMGTTFLLPLVYGIWAGHG